VQDDPVLECVVNVSEGRRPEVVGAIATSAGADLLDVHTDEFHHRAVLTLIGEAAPRAVAAEAVARLDLREHTGVHPRLGVVDVVPFVALAGSTFAEAVAARDAFSTWAASALGVPCFRYGRERSLPEVRRRAWKDLAPDTGPSSPHPSAGAMCVGARGPLVAYNVYLDGADLTQAREIAARVRGPDLRALGLQVGDQVQVSMNLVAPDRFGPAEAYDAVAALGPVRSAELVGLLPRDVLDAVPRARWARLDLDEDRTIEARLTTGSAGAIRP
jgi:glutamate formiminotransferase